MRLLKVVAWWVLALFSVGLLVLAGTYLYVSETLPSVDTLKDVQLQVPLQIFSSEGELIAEFGEVRRTPIAYSDIPPVFISAFLAAEDSNFRQHQGVDPQGLLRAAVQLFKSGHIKSGGSTITMQLAKNFFLSREQTLSRKLQEVTLALRIEHVLSKDQILDLYLNKIYLGKRAYGIVAAGNVYYGKPASELTLAEVAMIAGLPKAPSRYNPINNPVRAKERRDWILGRMFALGSIDAASYQAALQEPVDAYYHSAEVQVSAPDVAEMVRAEMVRRYGDEAYTRGFRVTTTLSAALQASAQSSVRKGLETYDKRHGYRGPEGHLSGPVSERWLSELNRYPKLGGLDAVAVTDVSTDRISVVYASGEQGFVPWQTMTWARRFIGHNAIGRVPSNPSDVVKVGDVIRVQQMPGQKLEFSQVPDAQSALVSVSPTTGAVQALVGGFDFNQSHFNRVVQAKRQPGSSFKPFIYSAALDNGFTAASLVNDAPIVFGDDYTGSRWRPQNDTRTFLGPIRLREALVHSRNMVSIRLLQAMGVDKTIDYISHFGFAPRDLPANLSLALGTASVSPMEVVAGWSVFANGGYKISPYIIAKIESGEQGTIYSAAPQRAPTVQDPIPEPLASRIIDGRTAYIMTSILQDVVKRGTAKAALKMSRPDIAGKTGTTSEAKDSWFTGYNAELVTSVWAGFDQPQSLGRHEWGVTVALPIWVDYMTAALNGTPVNALAEPEGIVTRHIDPQSGSAVLSGDANTLMEMFKAENAPSPTANEANALPGSDTPTEREMMDLF
ncbi:penicillin-binding protein 1A [Pseudomonas fluorescens BBc6R8]|uniref:penicillin-binding protein 1A n=1 Tax=Pseudomonas fluorescens TaxID=294 RepID=UPI000281CA25|nr:penicillin-binding protein 1A [Pseudomonas fluorescens]QQD55359.1 penicillin-binding protein 1A [Pseudomonas fluorescens BBc6R8]